MKYFKNTTWLLIEKILKIFVGLSVGVWIARSLGPAQFGALSYALSFVGLFATFTTLGLDGIVVRELVKDESRSSKLIGTAFWLKLFGATFVLVFLAVLIKYISYDLQINALILVIAASTVFQSFNVVELYCQSRVISKYIVYINMLSLLVSNIVKVILIVNTAPLIYFAYAIVFDSFILAIGYIYLFVQKSSFKILECQYSNRMAIGLLKDSYPLILSGLVISIYMKVDQIMIKEMLGATSVGQYAAAVKLSEACYFVPMIISSSIFPAILNAKKSNEKLYYARLQSLYDLMVWVAISIAIPVFLLSEYIIDFLYGGAYVKSAGVLTLHIWAGIFVFLGVASSKWFIAENLQIYSFYRTLLGAVINIMLNYLLIPVYGIHGAAFATLIAQISASYLFNITHKKLRYTFLLQTNAILLPFRRLGFKFSDKWRI